MSEGVFLFQGHTSGKTSVCPCCGKRSGHVHSYRLRKIQCTEVLSSSVLLHLRVRHFHCGNPACSRHIFSEPLTLSERYGRTSHAVCSRIRSESLSQTARSASQSLGRQHIHVSASICLRAVRRLGKENPPFRTSGYIGIDDFAKRKGHEYMCAAVDHYSHQVLAVFDSRYGQEITDWLGAHPEIRLVTRDGSQRYRRLIEAASPDIIQVADLFHLMKNLKEVSVELIRGLLGERKALMPYPYPSEHEALKYMREDILSMGDARHRERVGLYYRIRERKDAGESISQIASELGIHPQKVYRSLGTDISRILSPEQAKAMKKVQEMAQIVAAGCITPEIVARKMNGAQPTRMVCRSMRTLCRIYTERRRRVREHNKLIPQTKMHKVRASAIWNYIMTGYTTSQKLDRLADTHPGW